MEIQKVRYQLTTIDSQPYTNVSIAEPYGLMHQLNSLILAEESY